MYSSDAEPATSILIVEDNEESREILAAIIPRKFPGVAVYAANNGRTGLEMFKTHTPDIVITDINMPGLNGVQMADRIHAVNPDTQVIVLTADTGKATLEESVGKGLVVGHFILKPVDFGELFVAIERCLGDTALRKP